MTARKTTAAKKPAARPAAKKTATTAAAKTPARKSDTPAANRRPKAPSQQQLEQQQREAAQKFMSSGLDFSPFVIDAGDGHAWEFTPDPMPHQSKALSDALEAVSDTTQARPVDFVAVEEAFGELIEKLKGMLVNEKQRAEFPQPHYGQNALVWFGMHVMTGRDGFPTE